MSGYQKYLDRAQGLQKDRELGQASLFDLGPSTETLVVLEEIKPWSRTAALAYEKEVLGFYLSDHPLKGFDTLSDLWTTCKLLDLPKQMPPPGSPEAEALKAAKKDWKNRDAGKKRVIVAGLITELRELITKKGTRMAFARIEDLTTSVELVIFPDAYAKNEVLLKDERPVLIGGGLEVDDGMAKIMVDSVSPMEDILKKTKHIALRLDRIPLEDYSRLESLIKAFPGTTTVSFEIEIPEFGRRVEIGTPGISGISMESEFFESLHSMFGRTDFIEMRS
jgi:DNA polymerase-3 subunit alpha